MEFQPPRYRSLLIAGLGAVGRAMCVLGQELLASFERVVAVDRLPLPPFVRLPKRIVFEQWDITDGLRLGHLLDRLPQPVLFANLCVGVDNLVLRRLLADRDAAYLDAACSAPEGVNEVRFSRMMPYSLTPVDSLRPQWLCWGINPGLVELVARRLIHQAKEPGPFSVTVFEHDEIHTADTDNGRVAVGWCCDSLIEEVMESPTFFVAGGREIEDTAPGARPVTARWNGAAVPSRLVGHEDIWNLGRLPEVRDAAFVYGLHPRIMAVFDTGEVAEAKERFYVPPPQEPVYGHERVAVQVSGQDGWRQTLLWQEDHHQTWRRFGCNAVQYQTAKAVLFALLLMHRTPLGELAGNHTASSLPLGPEAWPLLDACLQGLAIRWQDASFLSLSCSPDIF